MRQSYPTRAPLERLGLGLMMTSGPGAPGQWHEAAGAFRELEGAGCAALWFTDHLLWHRPMPEALVMAAVAATATEQCVVGTGVLQLPLRRTAAVAKAAATLQTVAAGRFVLGVGAGEHPGEFRACGVEFGRRGAELDAGIGELRRLWRGGDGRYVQKPVMGDLPIWIGGRSEASLARAARLGDGWMPIFLGAEAYRGHLDRLDGLLEAEGRAAGAVQRAAVVVASVSDARWTRAHALDWAGELWGLEPERFARHLVSGSAAECAAELARYHEAGAQHVTVLLATDDPIAMFPGLAEQYRSVCSQWLVEAAAGT